MRWAARLAAVLAAAALVWATIGFIPAYFSDKSNPDKATYLGTIVGSTVALVAIIGWLRRRETSDSIATQLRRQTGTELHQRLEDMRRSAEDIALKYRASGTGEEKGLGGVVDALFTGFGRVVLTGHRERQVSRFSAAAAFPLLALGFKATWGTQLGIMTTLAYCLIVAETVACALWRRYLAMIIASAFTLPPDPAHFLKRMHALGHLRIAGVSYQFRHDDVLSYFANRDGLRRAASQATLLDDQNR